jgi:hypothetical protein
MYVFLVKPTHFSLFSLFSVVDKVVCRVEFFYSGNFFRTTLQQAHLRMSKHTVEPITKIVKVRQFLN